MAFVVREKHPLKAALMLFLATVFWGSSFVVMKGLAPAQEKLLPTASTWLLSALSIFVRFGIAGLLILAWSAPQLRQITRLEIKQGIGLGIFGGLGIVFQMDGVSHTSASTAAFLTQCYCIFIPVLVAIRQRRWPSKTVTVSTAMVLSGVAVLSQFDWTNLRLGRGEIETLIASVFFTGQILWLEKPEFQLNATARVSLVMFLVTAIVMLPIVALGRPSLTEIVASYKSLPVLTLTLLLTIFCTLVAYTMMNFWQPHLPATHAGLIYCSEPVFTSLFALFLPVLLSDFANISYENETLTGELILGGTLITAANILILIRETYAERNR
jgi:drug/metabolite transporter (DMT)-like permease